MAETYHGVEIPEDIWRDWITPFEDTAAAFMAGVRGALKIDPADRTEEDRLEALAEARDEAVQAAWQVQRDQNMAAWRKKMKEETDGTS
jgi:hypothetical protein